MRVGERLIDLGEYLGRLEPEPHENLTRDWERHSEVPFG
jgi:hypothetical protein